MRGKRYMAGVRRATAILAAGMMFQLGGCDFGQITVTQTLNTNELVISVIRGAILDPINLFITGAVNDILGVS